MGEGGFLSLLVCQKTFAQVGGKLGWRDTKPHRRCGREPLGDHGISERKARENHLRCLTRAEGARVKFAFRQTNLYARLASCFRAPLLAICILCYLTINFQRKRITRGLVMPRPLPLTCAKVPARLLQSFIKFILLSTNMQIRGISSRIIKNSRGEDTIYVCISTLDGEYGASAPSGKSKGKFEAPAWAKGGIKMSLKMIQVFGLRMKHRNFLLKKNESVFDVLKKFEKEIRLFEARYGGMGANVVYILEAVFLKALGGEKGKALWELLLDEYGVSRNKIKFPVPVGNCIGGGAHSHSEKKPDFQEFLLIPVKEKSFEKMVSKMLHAYKFVEIVLEKFEKKWAVKKNDENAWETRMMNEQVLVLMDAIAKKFDLKIGIDAASSGFWKGGLYQYKNKRLLRDSEEQLEYLERLMKKYKLFYVEDGFHEEDFVNFAKLTNVAKKMRPVRLVVGDDLTTTNSRRLIRAVKNKSINAIIIKPNQIGYLTEMKKVIDFSKKHDLKLIFSHRSGETSDTTIADLAVGFQGDFVKFGIWGRERLVKLRRIIEIERVVSGGGEEE